MDRNRDGKWYLIRVVHYEVIFEIIKMYHYIYTKFIIYSYKKDIHEKLALDFSIRNHLHFYPYSSMVSVRSSRLTIVVDDGDLGLLGGGSFPNAHWDKSSIGNGNIMVEFFSALIEFSVCKYRSYKRENRITSFHFYFLQMLFDYLVKYSFLNYHHKLSNYVTKNY